METNPKNKNPNELYNQAQERIYILKWKFRSIQGGTEDRTEFFSWEERSECIKRYFEAKEQWYAEDVRMLVAEPREVNVEHLLAQL